jgi:hypothetical protein
MSLDWRSIYEKSVVGIITAVALGALAGSLVLLSAPAGCQISTAHSGYGEMLNRAIPATLKPVSVPTGPPAAPALGAG